MLDFLWAEKGKHFTVHVCLCVLCGWKASAAAVSKWQELKLRGALDEVEEEEDIYTEDRMDQVEPDDSHYRVGQDRTSW